MLKLAVLIILPEIEKQMGVHENRPQVTDFIEQLKSFLNYSDFGYLILNKKGIIVEVSPLFLELTGYKNQELLGRSLYDIVQNTDVKIVHHSIEELQNTIHQKIFCSITKNNQSSIHSILHFTSIYNESGELEGATVIVDEISENKTNEPPSPFEKNNMDGLNSELFSTILQNSRDVVYIINYQTYNIEFISPSIFEMTGFTMDEIQSMDKTQILNIVHADYREMFKNHWKNLSNKPVNTKNYFSIEFKIRPKIGISRWLSDNRKLIWDKNGNLIQVVGNIRDITDFKLVEEALNRSRDRLTKAIEATNDGMWDWKLDTNKVYFDARFYTMADYLPNEFPHTFSEWMKRIHPTDISNVQNQLNKHLQGKSEHWIAEYRFQTKNDEWIWVLNRGKIFDRDDKGNPQRMVGTHTDISLRKKMGEELHKRNLELESFHAKLFASEEKFRQLAENMEDLFWLTDKETILYISPSFEKIWEQRIEEVLKNPNILSSWVHPDDVDLFHPILDLSILKKDAPCIEKYRIVKPNGEIRWIWSRRFPVFNENNELYRIAGIASDITNQKVIEDDLIATKEKALESDRLKSAFLANISHEIRTPMNGIIGFSGLLKDDTLTFENRLQFVNIINKSGEQLLHIIDDLIDISKIEANQLKIKITEVNLNELIADLQLFYENNKSQHGKDSVKIIGELQPDFDIKLQTDEPRLRQIFMNLISNALKFTDEGHIKFGFSVLEDIIEFYVEDTGIGISSDMQSAIFKRFRQVDDSSTRTFGGTGLGLAISEGLVKLLNGKIWLKSEKNQGATFYFSHPYCKGNTVVKKSTPNRETYDYDWSKYVILIVEDDYINQEFLSTILVPTNVSILQSYTAEEGINIVNSTPKIDLVLMDIRLPQMNGYEAFEIINKKYPGLPIIAQTAFAMSEDAARCLELGFANYIAKPIDRRNLLIMIDNLLPR